MTETKFTWVPFFEELGTRLLAYRANRGPLIKLLQDIVGEGLPMALLGKWTADIDPFTFLAAINRDLRPENRRRVAEAIRKRLGVQAPVPTDYNGVPVYSSQRARLVGDDPAECDILWRVLAGALADDPWSDKDFGVAVDSALKLVGVAHNLFIGLYWVRPQIFLPTDQNTRQLVKDIATFKSINFTDYATFVQQVRAVHKDFVQLSFDAWTSQQSKSVVPVDDEDVPPVLGLPMPDLPSYWFVGAMWSSSIDKTDAFLASSEWIDNWTNGIDTSSSEHTAILQMRPGERIAIKASYVRRLHLPFETGGKPASVMSIKATGTIRHNPLDGRRVEVAWDPKPATVREWYFYTNRRTVWQVGPDLTDFQAALVAFAFENQEQDYEWFLSDPYWKGKYGVTVAPPLPLDDSATVLDAGPPPKAAAAYGVQQAIDDGVFLASARLTQMVDVLRARKNVILQGPPGTGKTFVAAKLAAIFVGQGDDAHVRRVQFHQSMSYEDFVLGLRPQKGGSWGLELGSFMAIARAAEADQNVPHVLIIEEVNRGNPSAIFGELLTLLEADKRNSKYKTHLRGGDADHPWFVPPNLYVIGTMNRADRSLAPLDHALRRRFAFFDLQPHFGSFYLGHMAHREVDVGALAKLVKRVELVNNAIAADPQLGPDCLIGHSFFCEPPKQADEAALKNWFEAVCAQEVLPLLAEYWFGASGKTKLHAAKQQLNGTDVAG